MTCVTFPKFTVNVNRSSCVYFEGKCGLRKGDTISPLLFILVMEYRSRTLKSMSDLKNFKYHPMCKQLKLAQFIFADDLIIFFKGDVGSVRRVMEAIDTFQQSLWFSC